MIALAENAINTSIIDKLLFSALDVTRELTKCLQV